MDLRGLDRGPAHLSQNGQRSAGYVAYPEVIRGAPVSGLKNERFQDDTGTEA
jgi:hypothetical protein